MTSQGVIPTKFLARRAIRRGKILQQSSGAVTIARRIAPRCNPRSHLRRDFNRAWTLQAKSMRCSDINPVQTCGATRQKIAKRCPIRCTAHTSAATLFPEIHIKIYAPRTIYLLGESHLHHFLKSLAMNKYTRRASVNTTSYGAPLGDLAGQ